MSAASRKTNVVAVLLMVVVIVVTNSLTVEGFSLSPNRRQPTLSNRRLSLHPRKTVRSSSNSRCFSSTAIQMGFFKDMIAGAFENDTTLSKDKSKSQIEGPNTPERQPLGELTEVQKAWRAAGSGRGAISVSVLENKKFALDLYLVGIPSKDPSNDLFGQETNISSRDRSTGLMNLPDEPTISNLVITLEPNGVCSCDESPFTSGSVKGQWKLLKSDDDDDGSTNNNILRFSLDVLGYSRTVQTKGSIQNVFWTREESKEIATSTSYSIPPGWVYCDVPLSSANNPGTFAMRRRAGQEEGGVIRVEKKMGFLGAGSKLVACGTFRGKQLFFEN